VGPRAGLNMLAKRKIATLAGNRTPVAQPIAAVGLSPILDWNVNGGFGVI
jgi:hypothetical protein